MVGMDNELLTLTRILDTQGLDAGLKWLNSRVPHRWTAIYKLVGQLMCSTAIVDKQAQIDLNDLAVVPLQDSFCQFAMNDGKFVAQNTGEEGDPRLNGHPYKGVLNAYVGLPLMINQHTMYGTLCHFDNSSIPIADEEFEFLQHVAQLLPQYIELSRSQLHTA